MKIALSIREIVIGNHFTTEGINQFIKQLFESDQYACLIQADPITWIGTGLAGTIASETISEKSNNTHTDSVTAKLTYHIANKTQNLQADLFELIDAFNNLQLPFDVPLLMGYFAYEFLHSLEKVNKAIYSFSCKLPVAYFAFYRSIIKATSNGTIYRYDLSWHLDNQELTGIPSNRATITNTEKKENEAQTNLLIPNNYKLISDYSNFSGQSYATAVKEIKDAISLGEYYQVNLSQQVKLPCPTPREIIINNVIQTASAPRKAVIIPYNIPSSPFIISISPELFFSLADEVITCAPIKGTRQRTFNTEKDQLILRDLQESAKESAELAMIVDLVRNDLSRLCHIGSVHVTEHRSINMPSNLYHTYSVIQGNIVVATRLTSHSLSREIIHALFPSGSITGAPKIAAMNAITKFEQHERGPYCGALGYWGSNRSSHFNVAIRTATLYEDTLTQKQMALINSGGGITLLSSEREEYEETLHKIQGIVNLIFNNYP